MISEKMQNAISEQIGFEFYSAHLYLAMANRFEKLNYKGLAHWMRVQFNEEMYHAMKFFDYVNDRDGTVTLAAIPGVEAPWNTPLEVFEATYKHEQEVTARICNLVDIALSEKDYVTHNMLNWFVSEQVEEEANARDIVDRIRRVENVPDAMYRLDTELGARVLAPYVNLVNTAIPAV